jgi:hypothetical protein
MSEEIWKPVVGWEGIYEVSDHGNIRTVSRYVNCRGNGKVLLKSCIRKIVLNRYGYPVVTMEGGGKKKILKSIHRAVVEAFIGAIAPLMEVNHKDGVKTNNNLANLEIVTRKQNAIHMAEVLGKCRGEKSGQARLKNVDVLNICELLKDGLTQEEIAGRYDVDRTTISLIARGKNWSHLTGIRPVCASA